MRRILLMLLLLVAPVVAQTAHSVTLTWQETGTYTNFRVYRRPTGRTWWGQLKTGITKTTYTDTTVTGGRQYDYEVRAVLRNGTVVTLSDPSNVITVTIPQ